jgi:hypothetical protein
MHVLVSIALVLGGVALLVLALLRVLNDLLIRGPFDAPVIGDDAITHPSRREKSPLKSRSGAQSPQHLPVRD